MISDDYKMGKEDALEGLVSWTFRTKPSTWAAPKQAVIDYDRGFAKGKEILMLKLLTGN